jgi:hypothetical protein
MTEEMLALAWKNAAEAGAQNVEFLKGHIEEEFGEKLFAGLKDRTGMQDRRSHHPLGA